MVISIRSPLTLTLRLPMRRRRVGGKVLRGPPPAECPHEVGLLPDLGVFVFCKHLGVGQRCADVACMECLPTEFFSAFFGHAGWSSHFVGETFGLVKWMVISVHTSLVAPQHVPARRRDVWPTTATGRPQSTPAAALHLVPAGASRAPPDAAVQLAPGVRLGAASHRRPSRPSFLTSSMRWRSCSRVAAATGGPPHRRRSSLWIAPWVIPDRW